MKIPPKGSWMNISDARYIKRCRICRQPAEDGGKDNPFIDEIDKEYAHANCVKAAKRLEAAEKRAKERRR